MHEAKRHRAKCSRVRVFEPLFRLSARRRGILSGQCGFGASRFKHLRRQEASAPSFRAFSTSGGFEASILKLFRCLEASERAFSSIFDVWRFRSEHFRAISTSGGSAARIFEVSRGEQAAPTCKVPKSPRRQASLHNFCIDVICDTLF